MAEEIKFTSEELNSINLLRQQIGQNYARIGQINLEKKRRIDEFDAELIQLEGNHRNLSQQESDLFSQLNEKYGDGNFNPETGVFTPSQQAESEENIES